MSTTPPPPQAKKRIMTVSAKPEVLHPYPSMRHHYLTPIYSLIEAVIHIKVRLTQAVPSRMQFTLHATRRTPHGASRLVQALSAWLVKTRRAPSRYSRGARVYGHTATAMHKLRTTPSKQKKKNRRICFGQKRGTAPVSWHAYPLVPRSSGHRGACFSICRTPPPPPLTRSATGLRGIRRRTSPSSANNPSMPNPSMMSFAPPPPAEGFAGGASLPRPT